MHVRIAALYPAAFEQYLMRTRILSRAAQLAIFAAAGAGAFLLRFEFAVPRYELRNLLTGVAVWCVVKSIVFHRMGLHRALWRHVSMPDALRVANGNLLGSILSGVTIFGIFGFTFPRSVYVIDLMLCLLGTMGARLAARLATDTGAQVRRVQGARAIIYGAGDAGLMLAREIRGGAGCKYWIVGFVDDSPARQGLLLHRMPVLGTGAQLANLVKSHDIEQVLIAMPSATGAQMAQVAQNCIAAGVPFKTVPALREIMEGRALAGQMRQVDVEDLLGRDPVNLNTETILQRLRDRVVLVTGAAGSIGAELCRQIASFGPSRIVGFEIAETPLFYLQREMQARFPAVPFCAEIGSIQNPARLHEVFAKHRPAVVYHAAAYKHVPMMEANAFEALENNVFGTRNVALAAIQHRVSDFVLISSDKAVRPTSVMGATKRFAELLLLSLQDGGPKFVCVRFGNVLGSNGSVIPIFKEQIAAGGPVTITHPEMRRYFMTIPEAAQLVIQAASMGNGGEVFVLDMGTPVNICELARNLILLSGLRPGQDIKIEFTGVRPGEKLYEEINMEDETLAPTFHEKIRIFTGNGLPPGGMQARVQRLESIAARRNLAELVMMLKETIAEYTPSEHLLAGAVKPPERARAIAARAAAV